MAVPPPDPDRPVPVTPLADRPPWVGWAVLFAAIVGGMLVVAVAAVAAVILLARR